jgi:plasmid stability protein
MAFEQGDAMPNITVKNIPEALYEQLKQSARAHRRSINSEVLVCIERAVSPLRIDAESRIARARQLRERTAAYRITDDEIAEAKGAGRP